VQYWKRHSKFLFRGLLLSVTPLFLFSCGTTTASLPEIRDSAAIDAREIWLVTENGEVLSVVDEQSREVEKDISAQEIDVLNRSNAWILDSAGKVWSSEDEGKNWRELGDIRFGGHNQPSTVSFASKDVGWIVIGGGLILTEDGGRNWTQVTISKDVFASDAVRFPYEVYVLDPDNAVVTMSGRWIVRTSDRGRTWKDISFQEEVQVRSVSILNGKQLWVGTSGGLFYTADSGASWQQVLPDDVIDGLGISSISFASADEGWFTGIEFTRSIDESPDARGVVYKSIDGGRTWSKQQDPLYKTPFQKTVFLDPLNGWLIGDKVVYHTSNGGGTWKQVFSAEGKK
jgi:photosystem II stability/assembly factor-like uncharacterized protein